MSSPISQMMRTMKMHGKRREAQSVPARGALVARYQTQAARQIPLSSSPPPAQHAVEYAQIQSRKAIVVQGHPLFTTWPMILWKYVALQKKDTSKKSKDGERHGRWTLLVRLIDETCMKSVPWLPGSIDIIFVSYAVPRSSPDRSARRPYACL